MYACELAAFDGTDIEDERPFDEIERLIRTIAHGPWWSGPVVVVRRARAGTVSSVAVGSLGRADAPIEIRLADGQCTVATAAHELAHALAGVEHGHDDLFRRAYLDVVAMGTNLDPLDRRRSTHVDQLEDAFRDGGPATGGAPMATTRRRHGRSHRAVARIRQSVRSAASVGFGPVIRDVAQLG